MKEYIKLILREESENRETVQKGEMEDVTAENTCEPIEIVICRKRTWPQEILLKKIRTFRRGQKDE